jgi:ADP-ribose pyrophosphatase YjhB (NUDIX family)
MTLLYKIASGLRRVYWFIFRPKTTGVKCLIECDDNYLLIKQTYGSRVYNWNLPGGGVEKNEGTESAIKREVFEEIGIVLPNVIELKKYTSNFEYKVDTVYCFYSKVTTKNFVIDKKEILDAKWFPKNNLPENISRSIKESLAALPN